jgi:DNA-binding LacI/PurR family transcriptional regulator
MLTSEAADRKVEYIVELHHELLEAGHVTFYAPRNMMDLGMDVQRIARMVTSIEADAWIVGSASKEVLQWFAGRSVPAFALFGRRDGVAIASAGPDKRPAMTAAAQALLRLGHRRIVLLVRAARRLPEPGQAELAFLDALADGGLKVSDYNMPDWKETPEGLQELLSSLFRITPPTAMMIDEPSLFAATQQFLAAQGLRVPRDVSIICTDPDLTFTWCRPKIAHIDWDTKPVISRVMRWAASVSKNTPDLRQILTPATFHPGGTIGSASR